MRKLADAGAGTRGNSERSERIWILANAQDDTPKRVYI